ncbi:MAG TPA: NAD-dependent epimerase/dehydratase family protein [Xanthobacteraceae bacterium]|nr:NAD-dependent epimerase/dehydratase family protein [Xanthobacteraceae bacterium]
MPVTTRLMVTGATGFVGRAVVAAFAHDHIVRAAVRQAPQLPFADDVEIVQHPDLSQSFDWTPLLDGVDHVVHLAGIAHTGGDPASYDRVNHEATAELAAAAARAGVRRLVFVSSLRAQSGPAAERVLTENDEAKPTNAYGRSKFAAEAAVKAAGVPFTILRPVLLYGPGVKGNFAVLMRAARSPWPLPVKDFTNRRSLLGTDNFISALRFVLATPATAGETYIVADPGIPPRLPDVIATLRQAQGRRSLLVSMPIHYVESALRLIGRDALWQRIGGDLRADPGKLIAAGWQPAHDSNSGLAALAYGDAGTDLRPRKTMPPATPTPKM